MALAKGLQPERHSLSLRVRSFPFVSSEVETPIGTARSRRASRLRSMRTDMGFFMRIGIVAPSTPILPDDAEAVRAVVSLGYPDVERSEEHTLELQSLMRISYAVFCLNKTTLISVSILYTRHNS